MRYLLITKPALTQGKITIYKNMESTVKGITRLVKPNVYILNVQWDKYKNMESTVKGITSLVKPNVYIKCAMRNVQ